MKLVSSRRAFVSTGLTYAGAVSTGLGSISLWGCKTTDRSNLLTDGNAAVLRQRKSVSDPTNKDNVDAYITAFHKIKDTSIWRDFAAIHSHYCPHGNWYFLPWHRVYIYHFEKMIAQVSGKSDFALPYWDWDGEEDNGKLRNRLPNIAFDPNGIHWAKRTTGNTEATAGEIDLQFVGKSAIKRIMDTSDFLAFGSGRSRRILDPGSTGILEGMPHNRIHVFVGGDMGTMRSPLDPVFWMHHCNVDRLWAKWQAKQIAENLDQIPAEGTGNQPKTSEWLKTELVDGFLELNDDQDGTRAVTKKFTVDDTIFKPQLFGYTYEKLAAGVVADGAARTIAVRPTSFSVDMDVAVKRSFIMEDSKIIVFAIDVKSSSGKASDGATITAEDLILRFREAKKNGKVSSFNQVVDGVPVPADPASYQLMFYIDRNIDTTAPRLIVPQEKFLGAHAFFGHGEHAEHHGDTVSLAFDLADVFKDRSAQIINGTIYLSVKVESPHDFSANLKEKLKALKVKMSYSEI